MVAGDVCPLARHSRRLVSNQGQLGVTIEYTEAVASRSRAWFAQAERDLICR
jgi:hypothetical protein